ncbi:MAG TPA: ATP-binding cassette domain-containing protein, partial [Actinomycetales bacterium]|nr:ATP-binding cassette domain-containing protein [Actinomycetales bacterium]
MIEVTNVSQTFLGRKGSVHALEDINLHVADNEFVTLVGRSGCGKSTLLRIIAGLIAPTQGQVVVAGDPVQRPRRDVSVMFQRPALLPWRSVLDNVLLPAEVIGIGRQEARSRADDLLELVGLSAFAHRLPHELSGGMQQRV